MFVLKRAEASVTEVSYVEAKDLAGRESSRSVASFWRAFVLDGDIDLLRLQHAADLLSRRHEALRTRFFRTADGVFCREVLDDPGLRVNHEDWRDRSCSESDIHDRILAAYRQGFGLDDFPYAHLLVLQLAHNRSVLFLSVAETIADASAFRVLLQDLTAYYAGASELPPLPFQLSDFVASHNAWLASPGYAGQLAQAVDAMHKRIVAAGGIEQLLNYAGGEQDAFTVSHKVPAAVCRGLESLAAAGPMSLPTLVMAACAIASARARGAAGTFFTTSFSNRNSRATERLVGRLATTLPNYLQAAPDEGLIAVAGRAHRDLFSAAAYRGAIPVQHFVDAICERFPDLPPGAQIRFGKTMIDAMVFEHYDVLGLPTRQISFEVVRPTTNDAKFVCRIFPGVGIDLSMRGRNHAASAPLVAGIFGCLDDVFAQAVRHETGLMV